MKVEERLLEKSKDIREGNGKGDNGGLKLKVYYIHICYPNMLQWNLLFCITNMHSYN